MYVQKESILSNINYVVWSRSFQIIYIYKIHKYLKQYNVTS